MQRLCDSYTLRSTAAALIACLACGAACHDSGTGVPQIKEPPETGSVWVGAGNTGNCTGTGDEETEALLDTMNATVFTTGNSTVDGSTASFANCYEPSWGKAKARTRPAPGKKDYVTAAGAAYFGYYGANAGDPATGYYSYELGDWHIVVLNTNLSYAAGSPQELWLKSDLAASTKLCQAAVWQLPRFYSGDGSTRSSLRAVWDDLYAAGVEVVVNGDWGWYERYAPQSSVGVLDSANGVREFIVGTGGQGLNSFGTPYANSEVRIADTYGVLKMVLGADKYRWTFLPVHGKTAGDSGSYKCHGAAPPVAQPGGPYAAEREVHFDASGSYDPANKLPLTYAWSFGDGSTGSGVAPVHTYATNGAYSATLIVTNAAGAQSLPKTTSITIANLAPTTMMNSTAATAGVAVRVSPLFDDAPVSGPWAYQVNWGDGAVTTGEATAPGSIPLNHTFARAGNFAATFTVTDRGGLSAHTSFGVDVGASATPPSVLVGAGDIASCSVLGDDQTATLVGGIAGTVFTVGDNVYESGTTAEYANCYAPTWGQYRSRTWATLGNHDYEATPNADPTFAYFGAGVGVAGKGYYSWDVGNWHVIVLNSMLDMSAGSAQMLWLRDDLAAAKATCTIAMWHHPRFSSGNQHGNNPMSDPAWRLLYDAGAEIVLSGHDHDYERFAPQTPDAAPSPNGMREFIVGTGGKPDGGFGVKEVNSEVRIAGTVGVLKLTLSDGSYEWQFIEGDGTIGDSGSGTCH